MSPPRLPAILWLLLCAAPAGGTDTAADRQFEHQIAPLLSQRCLECHSGAAPKGGLDLTTAASVQRGGKHGPALVRGQPEKSLLWERVEAGEMPPRKPLSATEKQHLHAWIKAGAAWSGGPLDPFRFTTTSRAGYDWWSLQPVRRPEPPAVKQGDWPRTPVDRFLLARLEAHGWQPAPEADRRTLIRRLSFDLLGLPPSPEAVDAFVHDPDPAAYERLVDRFLASPHYGERWARHWLDVVRFGESNGYEYDELRKNAWPYRDWVIQALNRDLPYDEFARLQIAGDVLASDDPTGIIATGFLVAGSYDTVGQKQQSAAMKAVVRQEELEDLLGTLGQTFLGLTVQCARCHDHKFDPVRQEDYYRLAAALAGVRHGERDITPAVERERFARERAARQQRLRALQAELARLEQSARQQVLRGPGTVIMPARRPVARWDFTRGLHDQVGTLDVRLAGDARQTAEGLVLPRAGKGFASTAPLPYAVKARTLAVWVKLADLEQRGGGVMTLQTLDGSIFDALVFGERDPGQWLAGSNSFQRTQPFHGPVETEAAGSVVSLVVVYGDDGTVAAYRNGRAYGQSYRANASVSFEAGKAQVLFGLRHSPPGCNKHLAGTIVRAELHDTALSPAEVGVLTNDAFITDEQIAAHLDGNARVQRRQLIEAIEALRRLPGEAPKRLVYAVTPQPAEPSYLLVRGEPARKGPVVAAGGVASLGAAGFTLPADAPEAECRRKLALWLTDCRNPLFARVMVNRLWHYHFGAGLVETPSDFGFNGGRPSHAELLDWLADEFVRQDFSLKAMHRLLVTSAVYRQQSRYRADPGKLDAGNRLLWRKAPLRLEAEAVRDSILAVSGALNPRLGGPGYHDFEVSIRGVTYSYTPIDQDDIDLYRRSIYRTLARSGRNRLLDALDCPDPSTVTPRRAVTTTPLQALSLLNNSFLLRMADRFAERVQHEAGADVTQQLQRAFALALGRSATPEEIERAHPVARIHGLAAVCRALFNSNEFMYVD